MKKTYIMPATAVVKIATTQMIAQSLNSLPNAGGKVSLSTEEAENGSATMGRRGSGLWDEED